MPALKAKELSIVMIGKFNPVIINPNWLAGKDLISDPEAKEALEGSNYITHPEVSQFRLPYCNVQTLQDRYTITSTHEGYFDKLHELTMAIFNFLRETPILQIGINTIHHYEFVSVEKWNSFGDMIAPKEMWKPVTKNPGLKRMEIKSQREDGLAGEINTSIGVSEVFPERGVRIHVNDHYNLYTQEERGVGKNINALKSLEILESWNDKQKVAQKIISGVINYEKK